MLSRLSVAVGASTPTSALSTSVTLKRLLHTTNSISSTEKMPGGGTGSEGSKGAAPGRAGGDDSEVKFGDSDASASSGELYGREDRDPMPSPNPAVNQANSPNMSFPRDEPSRQESAAGGSSSDITDGSGAPVAKEEGIKAPEAYPIQNDPSVPDGAGPELSPELANKLQQDESSGPKAAGQGVVEGLAKKDPERYGSGRSSPA